MSTTVPRVCDIQVGRNIGRIIMTSILIAGSIVSDRSLYMCSRRPPRIYLHHGHTVQFYRDRGAGYEGAIGQPELLALSPLRSFSISPRTARYLATFIFNTFTGME